MKSTVDESLQNRRTIPVFPRVALIGREALTTMSTSGNTLKAHFSNYPKAKLLDLHWRSLGSQYLFPRHKIESNDLRSLPWSASGRKRLNYALGGFKRNAKPCLVYKNRIFDPVEINWEKVGGPPDVIYSTCGSASEFAFLHHVYKSLPKKVPILQHFVDVDFSDYNFMVDLYLELSPAIKTVWVNTKPTFYATQHFSPLKPEFVQALHVHLPKNFKLQASEFGRAFRPLLAGASHQHASLVSMHHIWSEAQERLNKLPPISWVGHPPVQKRIKDSAVHVTGHTSEASIQAHMNSADLGILPVTSEVNHGDQQTYYNLASRISDYCARGVPIVAISFYNTATQQLVDEHEIGVVLDPTDRKLAVRKLTHFLSDRDWREECGQRARYFAEKDLDAKIFQRKLYSKLYELSSKKAADKSFPAFNKSSFLSSNAARVYE